jgi:hypothetical protein
LNLRKNSNIEVYNVTRFSSVIRRKAFSHILCLKSVFHASLLRKPVGEESYQKMNVPRKVNIWGLGLGEISNPRER